MHVLAVKGEQKIARNCNVLCFNVYTPMAALNLFGSLFMLKPKFYAVHLTGCNKPVSKIYSLLLKPIFVAYTISKSV